MTPDQTQAFIELRCWLDGKQHALRLWPTCPPIDATIRYNDGQVGRIVAQHWHDSGPTYPGTGRLIVDLETVTASPEAEAGRPWNLKPEPAK